MPAVGTNSRVEELDRRCDGPGRRFNPFFENASDECSLNLWGDEGSFVDWEGIGGKALWAGGLGETLRFGSWGF